MPLEPERRSDVPLPEVQISELEIEIIDSGSSVLIGEGPEIPDVSSDADVFAEKCHHTAAEVMAKSFELIRSRKSDCFDVERKDPRSR